MVGYGTFEDVMTAFETALRSGPYLLGERFSAADVYVGSQLGWGLMFKTMEARPGFAEYVARLQSRPAAKRARELDDAAMPPQA
jgi:glutathione S-transferase